LVFFVIFSVSGNARWTKLATCQFLVHVNMTYRYRYRCKVAENKTAERQPLVSGQTISRIRSIDPELLRASIIRNSAKY